MNLRLIIKSVTGRLQHHLTPVSSTMFKRNELGEALYSESDVEARVLVGDKEYVLEVDGDQLLVFEGGQLLTAVRLSPIGQAVERVCEVVLLHSRQS